MVATIKKTHKIVCSCSGKRRDKYTFEGIECACVLWRKKGKISERMDVEEVKFA